jgi:hypothetical protein
MLLALTIPLAFDFFVLFGNRRPAAPGIASKKKVQKKEYEQQG